MFHKRNQPKEAPNLAIKSGTLVTFSKTKKFEQSNSARG